MDPRSYHRRRELEAIRKAHNEVLTTQLEGLHAIRSGSVGKTRKKRFHRSDLLISMADPQTYHQRVVDKAKLAAKLAAGRRGKTSATTSLGEGDAEAEYAALLAEGVNEDLLLDDAVAANLRRKAEEGTAALDSDEYDSDDSSEGRARNSVSEAEKLLDDEYYYKRALNLGSVSTGREVWAGGAGAERREPMGAAEQRLKRRRAPVLSTHLVNVHKHVRQFYEVLSAWLAPLSTETQPPNHHTSSDGGATGNGEAAFLTQSSTPQQTESVVDDDANPLHEDGLSSGTPPHHQPPFPFALTWLRTVLPADVVGESGDRSSLAHLDDGEARRILRRQIARSQRLEESSMYDPSDYAALEESILSYLSLTYFAVSNAVSHYAPNSSNGGKGALQNGGGSRDRTPRNRSPTHSQNLGADEGRRSPPMLTVSRSTKPCLPDSNFPSKTAPPHRTSPRREWRPTSGSEKADVNQRPVMVNMHIARAVCRPGSASVAVSLPSTTTVKKAATFTTGNSPRRPATAGKPASDEAAFYTSPREKGFGRATEGANRDKHPLAESVTAVDKHMERLDARMGLKEDEVSPRRPQTAGPAVTHFGTRSITIPRPSVARPASSSSTHPPLSYRPKPPSATVEFAIPNIRPSHTTSHAYDGAPSNDSEVVNHSSGNHHELVSREAPTGISSEVSRRPPNAIRPDGLVLASGPGSAAAAQPPLSVRRPLTMTSTATVLPTMGEPGSYKATWGPHSDSKWVGRRGTS